MSKRAPQFERRERDDYPTPYAAVPPLIPHLRGVKRFAEPCAGGGALIGHMQAFGLECVYAGDIGRGADALRASYFGPCDAIITNCPWDRKILHPMILHFQSFAPTWLLFDGDWAFTKQAVPFIDQCSHIVAVGRVKWIEDSKHTGKDNAAWYRFHAQHQGGPRFFPKMLEVA